MNSKSAFAALALSMLTLGVTTRSLAAPTTEAANLQIDNAINTHYAGANLDKAEQALMAVIDSCGTTCEAAVSARAWMYIGIVRGSGRDDLEGASAAFAHAKGLSPTVALDDLFATDIVKKVFDETRPLEQLPLMNDMRRRADLGGEISEINCSLSISEVETHRPIPISCQAPPASRLVLYHRHERSTKWKAIEFRRDDSQWSAEIPCTETSALGVLAYYVQSMNSEGKPLDELGSKVDPLEVDLVDQTEIEAPAFPGQAPPNSCRPEPEAPAAAGPKLGSYGDACTTAAQCQGGLTCDAGQCVADMSCEADAECPSGVCDDGLCAIPDLDCEGEDCAGSRVSLNWFGIQGSTDFSLINGTGLCGLAADDDFSCYDEGEFYRGIPNENFAGDVSSGFRRATTRVMASYERGLSEHLAVEGRLGFAFNGGPTAPSPAEDGDGSKFMPYHAEARLKVYFTGLYADDGRGLLGASAFAMAGGGLAQVDPQITVPVGECAPADRPDYPNISPAQDFCLNSTSQSTDVKQLKVVQRQGQGFVTAGLGFRYGFSRHFATVLTVNSMFLLPSSGLTISPSLGILAGF